MGVLQNVFGGAPARTAFTARKEPSFSRSESFDNAAGDRGWSDFYSQSLTGVKISQQTALGVAAVMACVSIISEDVAKLTPDIFTTRADGGREVAKNHPLRRVLKRPNDWQTPYEFCQMMMIGLLLRGNGYAIILRDGRGNPIALVPINPDRVLLWEAPNGSLYWVVTRSGLHEMAVLADVPYFIPYEDVLHWKGLSGNGLVGISKISANREAIGLAAAMEQLASRTIGNGARPSGVAESDKKITKEVADNLKQRWYDTQGGLENSGKLLVLEEGLKWKPMSLTFADMQFIASRKYQNNDIANIFRIPGYMIGEDAKVSKSNMSQQAQEYLNNTLMSYVDIIEQRWSFTFDLGDEYFVALDLMKILKADLASRYAAYRIGQMGWLTVNEIRLAEGMNPVEGGGQIMRPVNMAPLTSDVFLGLAQPDTDPAADPVDPAAPPPEPGSEVTGEGAEGGGRPPADGTDPAPSD